MVLSFYSFQSNLFKQICLVKHIYIYIYTHTYVYVHIFETNTHTHTHTHTYIVVVQSLSHVQLFSIPQTVARQAPLSIGLSRQEYWSGLPIPPPGDLPGPGIEPRSPALAGKFFTTSHLGSLHTHTHTHTHTHSCSPLDMKKHRMSSCLSVTIIKILLLFWRNSLVSWILQHRCPEFKSQLYHLQNWGNLGKLFYFSEP